MNNDSGMEVFILSKKLDQMTPDEAMRRRQYFTEYQRKRKHHRRFCLMLRYEKFVEQYEREHGPISENDPRLITYTGNRYESEEQRLYFKAKRFLSANTNGYFHSIDSTGKVAKLPTERV